MKIRSQFLTNCLVWVMTRSLQVLFATVRVRTHHEDPASKPFDDAHRDKYVFAVWHDSVAYPSFGIRHRNTTVLTSRHNDGGYVAGLMQLLGMKPVRGSTNRGGAEALRQLIADTVGELIVIAPDGPRGPRNKISAGIVFLASHTGRVILPTTFHCTREWVIPGSWTDLRLPQPFSSLTCISGPPIAIGPHLRKDQILAEVARVQAAMDELAQKFNVTVHRQQDAVESEAATQRAA
jgi:lysophospholipid acyltransferase (LPLAT)-like uncharacterized protein